MKIQIVKTIVFLTTAPYIAWEARKDDEVEYYKNLAESREVREEVEKKLYEDLQKDLRNEPSEKREMIINFHRFLKGFLNQSLEGFTDSLNFAHWLRTKINSSEKQVSQLDRAIKKIERLIQELENKEIGVDTGANIKEDGYEIINQQQIAYEKEKQEWQRLLIELESRFDFLTAQNWINYDLVEEEVSHGEYEYTLITQIQGLEAELELEREESKKALDKAQEWRERQIKEVTEQKDQQIQKLQVRIKELEKQLTNLQLQEGKFQSSDQSQTAQIQQITKPFTKYFNH